MSTSRYVVIVPDGHIYVSRCGVRKSFKEPLTMTNYVKYLPNRKRINGEVPPYRLLDEMMEIP